MPSKNIILYAKWSQNSTSYVINYYLENAEGEFELDLSKTLFGINQTSVSINNKDYHGYELFDEHIDSKLVGILNTDETLILSAYYKRLEYTVTFKDYDDEIIATAIVHFNDHATAPQTPTRVGYTFYKWDKDLNNIATDLEIKALYKVNSYRINLNVNSGNESFADLNIDYEAIIKDLPTPTKTGFRFDGWYLDNEMINLPYLFSFTNDVIFIANWSESLEGITY